MRSTHDDIQLCPLQTIKVVESEMLVFEMLEKELELEHCHPLLPASLQCDLTATPGRSIAVMQVARGGGAHRHPGDPSCSPRVTIRRSPPGRPAPVRYTGGTPL